MEQKNEGIVICSSLEKTFVAREKRSKRVAENHVIGGIDLNVKEREFVVVFGPGQCGKTTLLNLMAGLEQASAGSIRINGKLVTRPNRDSGMVYQTTALFPWLTVMGNVEFGLKMAGMPKKKRQERAQHYIDLVGLSGFEKSYPVKLSGGMRQRVGIARAYCKDPKVIFMDEPFGHLDAQTRYLMEEEIERICAKEQKTVVFVTNNIEEAIYLADRIILLTECPARVKAEFPISLPRPRDYVSKEFLALRDLITNQMDETG